MPTNTMMTFVALAGISALADASIAAEPPCATSDGTFSTACGSGALANNSGTANSALGYAALVANTNGYGNTASGVYALASNTGGAYNTGSGYFALSGNTSGSDNTAVGTQALTQNTSGYQNTALGNTALFCNTTGSDNTALGNGALSCNETGTMTANDNTAVGANALGEINNGNSNSALGASALYSNSTASNVSAVGYQALYSNTTGSYGTALGYESLFRSQSGIANIGVGPLAGQNIVKGELNIDIGSWGAADESNTIRIGLPQYHLHTFIAGIATTQITGAQVVVTASGQLGVLASSERYKTDISPLSSGTEKLSQLRPVSFHLKTEPDGALQYGLIAEEVDEVYPELVIRDNDGRVQGVRYDELAPMLLNEVQKEQGTIAAQAQHAAAQDAEIAQLRTQLAEIRAALAQR